MGLIQRNVITWTNRSKCPPVEDCAVKNTVKKGATAKQARAARKLAAAQKAQREQARAAKKAKGKAAAQEPQKKGWPFAGSYDPKQERKRGR